MSATTRKTITCSELLWEQCEEEFKKLKEDNKKLKEENEKLKNVICNPLISCNGINCRGKEKFIQYRIKEYEETIWKIENGATGMGDKN